jgi:hypothetical protein
MDNKIKIVTAVIALIAAILQFPFPSTPESNGPPVTTGISSNASSLTYMGDAIKFVSRASDPEDNPIEYKFLLKGPYTDNVWRTMTNWSKSKAWTWYTKPCYPSGKYAVQALVRDKKHSLLDEGDDPNPETISANIDLNKCPEIQEINIHPPNAFVSSDDPCSDARVDVIATDQEGDPILYKFSVRKGLSLFENFDTWEIARDWSELNCLSNVPDEGLFKVRVEVKDNKPHCDKCKYKEKYSRFELKITDGMTETV